MSVVVDRPVILSIWKVDPIGGEFVKWPENLDDAMLKVSRDIHGRWLAECGAYSVAVLRNAFKKYPGGWTAHDELSDCDIECGQVLSGDIPILGIAKHDRENVLADLEKIRNAITVAMSIPEAGLCVSSID
jgi:hypothetical protein